MADLSNPTAAQRSASQTPPRDTDGGVRVSGLAWRQSETVGDWQVRPVDRSEIHAAVRLMLGRLGELAEDAAVLDFLRFAVARKIDLGQMQVVAGDRGGAEGLKFVATPIAVPGGSAIVSCTAAPPAQIADAASAALSRACDGLADAGHKLAQVLTDPKDQALDAIVKSAGFGPIAELVYMLREVPPRPPTPNLPAGVRLETFDESAYARFRDTVAETYVGSLDCPALAGVRSMDDVMAGHRAAGDFVPAFWQLVVRSDEPLGVVLLARVPNRPLAEVVYLGLVPQARGQGLSGPMMQAALSAARTQGCDGLTLAVDAANTPAIRLYQRHGMRQIYTRNAWMKRLGQGSGQTVVSRPGLA
ncbi:MAG: GNAT family N-acetyltransferase [Planctomycetota bacterium]